MSNLPPPPVPERLREILRDYPGLIQQVQDRLSDLVAKPFRGTPIFEQAIWALEGITTSFLLEAQGELQAAQASGDAEAIRRAEEKGSLMRRAGSGNGGLKNLDELYDYLEQHKEAFR